MLDGHDLSGSGKPGRPALTGQLQQAAPLGSPSSVPCQTPSSRGSRYHAGPGRRPGRQCDKAVPTYHAPVPYNVYTLAGAFRFMEIQERAELIKTVFASDLSDRFIFSHFVTLTLRDRRVPGSGIIPLGTVSLARAWTWFQARCRTYNGGRRPAGLMVVEYQRRGVPHIHALMIMPGAIGSERKIETECWFKFGRSTVWRYKPALGAGYYLSKYIVKDARVSVSTVGELSRFGAPLVAVGENGPDAQLAVDNASPRTQSVEAHRPR